MDRKQRALFFSLLVLVNMVRGESIGAPRSTLSLSLPLPLLFNISGLEGRG